ncbi:MAG: hypothetical protein R3Y12_02360 [Clostridia bacterium]
MEIKILHVYHDLLDLYGDFFNIKFIQQKIQEMGYVCNIYKKSISDDIDFTEYDVTYMGHGKASCLVPAVEHLIKNQESFKKAVELEKVFLIVGNSRFLLGEKFETWNGEVTQGIGLFNYQGKENKSVYTTDVISSPVFDESIKVYGFINRTGELINNDTYPLFSVEKGKLLGQNEGNLYKNLIATWQLGPILVRNPSFTKNILQRILNKNYKSVSFALEEKAYALTICEFWN